MLETVSNSQPVVYLDAIIFVALLVGGLLGTIAIFFEIDIIDALIDREQRQVAREIMAKLIKARKKL